MVAMGWREQSTTQPALYCLKNASNWAAARPAGLAITKGYNLKVKYVIHTVGPV